MIDGGSIVRPGENRFLEAIPAAQRHRLMRSAGPVVVEIRTVLFEPGQPVEFADFPLTCVISLVTPFGRGASVEVATVGNEGIVGVPMVLGGSLAVRGVVSVGGSIARVPAATFLREVHGDGHLHERLDAYLQTLFGQIAQATACNRLHSTTARLSGWLLTRHDRVGADEIAMTLGFLGQMLGCRPAAIAHSIDALETAGLIKHRPGRIVLVDVPGLEAVACECYATLKQHLAGTGNATRRHVDLAERAVPSRC
jgi:Crp-like helix-turn-helix domain